MAFCGIGDRVFIVVLIVTASLAFHAQVVYFLVLANVSFQYDGATWGDLMLNRWMIPATLPGLWVGVRLARAWRREQGTTVDLFSESRRSSNPSANAVWSDVYCLAARAGLSKAPELRFGADAGPGAHVESTGSGARIVIFAQLFKRFSNSGDRERAVLAHEMSHVEVDDMRLVSGLRKAAWVYVSMVLTVGLASVGLFLLRRYELAWDDSPVALCGRLFFCVVAAIVPFLYVRQFLIQREYLHDRRATQLMGDGGVSLCKEIEALNLNLLRQSRYQRVVESIRHFLQFHPLPRQRLRALSMAESLVIDSLVYPFFAGLLLPLASVALFFISGDLASAIGGSPSELATALLNGFVFAALTLAMFAADIARFALLAARSQFDWIVLMRYLILVAIGCFAGAFPILLIPSSREVTNFSTDLIYLVVGAAWTVTAQAGLFLALVYTWAVELNCRLMGFRRKAALVLRWLLAFPVVLCFQMLFVGRGFSGGGLTIWIASTLGCIGVAIVVPQVLAIGVLNRRGQWLAETVKSVLLKTTPSEFDVLLCDPTVGFGGRRSRVASFIGWPSAVLLFFVPTAFAFAWHEYARQTVEQRSSEQTGPERTSPDAVEVYRAVMVYALSRAADEDGNVKINDMQSAVKAALPEAATLYCMKVADVQDLVKQGQRAVDDAGQFDVSTFWPLVQRARQLAAPTGKPPTFEDCQRATVTQPRNGDSDGPHAIG